MQRCLQLGWLGGGSSSGGGGKPRAAVAAAALLLPALILASLHAHSSWTARYMRGLADEHDRLQGNATSRTPVELVVAHYSVPLTWVPEMLRELGAGAGLTVYTKGGNASTVPGSTALPNVGREAHTYVHHLHTRYYSLADITLFVMDSATRSKCALASAGAGLRRCSAAALGVRRIEGGKAHASAAQHCQR